MVEEIEARGLTVSPHVKYEGLWSVVGDTGRQGVGRSPRHAMMWYSISNLEPEGLFHDGSSRVCGDRCVACGLPWREHPADNRNPAHTTRIACNGALFEIEDNL